MFDDIFRTTNENVITTTPLSSNNFLNPQRRLFVSESLSFQGHSFVKLKESLINQLQKSSTESYSDLTNICVPEVPRHPRYPNLRSHESSNCDRFLPSRKNFDNELSHYLLIQKDHKEKDQIYLDVFEDIKYVTDAWRRKYMDRAFRHLNLFQGNRRILNIGEQRSSFLEQETCNDSQWPCRPRKQPLMHLKLENANSYRDYGAQIFRFAFTIKSHNLIDWGAKEMLAVGLSEMLCICDVDFKHSSKIVRIDRDNKLCSLKFNTKGDKIAIGEANGDFLLYDTSVFKELWSRKCICIYENEGMKNSHCQVNVIVWASKDDHIITGCTEGRLLIRNSTYGKIMKTILFADDEIIEISISPNEKYLAVSALDKLVKVLSYPSLEQIFEIEFFTYVKAIAWHPWRSGILCLGGGPGDGGISVWNVSNQSQICYRKIKFVGSVDKLMFNKLSGELLVHWYYLLDQKIRSKIVVLSDIDKIVDVLPIESTDRMINIVWSPDHTKIATQYRNALLIWNFFGNESNNWINKKETENIKKYHQNEDLHYLMDFYLKNNKSNFEAAIIDEGFLKRTKKYPIDQTFQRYNIR